MENCFFSVRVHTRQDYLTILEGGLWIALGHYLKIEKWHPNFWPSTEVISSTTIWIRLLGLPLELFEKSILLHVARKLGKAVKLDRSMAVTRDRFARIFVEIDLMKLLIPRVKFLGHLQNVECESLHLVCFTCGQYGHKSFECPTTARNVTAPLPRFETARPL